MRLKRVITTVLGAAALVAAAAGPAWATPVADNHTPIDEQAGQQLGTQIGSQVRKHSCVLRCVTALGPAMRAAPRHILVSARRNQVKPGG